MTATENQATPQAAPVSAKNMNVPIRNIKTKLIKKEELFLTMALAEVTGLPMLFVGPPGVAKTAALIDYMAAMMNYDAEKAREKLFILELDESTKGSEIKGRINMKEYLENHNFLVDTPIVEAQAILINEVDKGSATIRNTMLSIMRERRLFLGKDIRKCEWKIFAASCNVIPTDELENPFWDRFVIKHTVDRVSSNDIMDSWSKKTFTFPVAVPSREQMEAVEVNMARMKIFCDTIYKSVSDRTLSYVPDMVKAVKIIWRMTDVEAIVKVCQYIAPKQVNTLAGVIEDTRITTMKNELQNLRKMSDPDEVKVRLEKMIFQAASFGNSVTKEDLEGIVGNIRHVSYHKKMSTIKDHIDKKINALLNGEDPALAARGTSTSAFNEGHDNEGHDISSSASMPSSPRRTGRKVGTQRVPVDIEGAKAEEEPQF